MRLAYDTDADADSDGDEYGTVYGHFGPSGIHSIPPVGAGRTYKITTQ